MRIAQSERPVCGGLVAVVGIFKKKKKIYVEKSVNSLLAVAVVCEDYS